MKKVLLLMCTVLLGTTPAFASFSDVQESSEFATYINWLQDQGVVQGYEDGTFGTYKNINRAEFLKMLYVTKLIDNNTGVINTNTFPKNNPFKDVENTAWYYEFVMQAYVDGIVQGYGDGTFRPGNNITLSEAMKIVQEAFFEDNMGVVLDEGCSSVDVFRSCGPAKPDTDALTGCKRITNEDWSFTYFCVDKLMNIHGEGMWVQADLPISRGLMAQLLYRTKAIRDNNFVKYSSEISPNALSFKYEDPNGNYTLTFPNSWKNMVSHREEFSMGADDSKYFATGFGVPEQENMFYIGEYSKDQWASIVEEGGLMPEYLGEKGEMVFTYSHAQDCIEENVCTLMRSLERIRNSFMIKNQIVLQAN